MKKLLARPPVRQWLALVGTASLVLGAAYAMAQQVTRLSADDLPRSAANTASQELQNGSTPKDVVPALKTDLAKDSSLFVIVTDGTQHILASSASLDGQTPLPPQGVFSFTTYHGTDHFTWEPRSGVRLATRVLKYGDSPADGFIIAGQSLRPYEERISVYTWLALAAWLAVLAWSYLLLLLPYAQR